MLASNILREVHQGPELAMPTMSSISVRQEETLPHQDTTSVIFEESEVDRSAGDAIGQRSDGNVNVSDQ